MVSNQNDVEKGYENDDFNKVPKTAKHLGLSIVITQVRTYCTLKIALWFVKIALNLWFRFSVRSQNNCQFTVFSISTMVSTHYRKPLWWRWLNWPSLYSSWVDCNVRTLKNCWSTVQIYVICDKILGGLPSLTVQSFVRSLRFLVPGLLYTMNSNIYLIGLTMVPPTIWLILCSARTVFTALVYKVNQGCAAAWLNLPMSYNKVTTVFVIHLFSLS